MKQLKQSKSTYKLSLYEQTINNSGSKHKAGQCSVVTQQVLSVCVFQVFLLETETREVELHLSTVFSCTSVIN